MKKPLILIFMLLFVSVMSYGQLTSGKSKPTTTTKTTTKTTSITDSYGFTAGKHYLGPAIGFNFSNSSLTLGANYEYALDKNFGLGGVFRYTSYTENLIYYDYGYTLMFFGAQVNYHIKGLIEDKKFDPFVGLVLGLHRLSWKTSGIFSSSTSNSANSDLFLSAHATMRYWLNPNIGLQGRLEFGSYSSSALMLGVDFKF